MLGYHGKCSHVKGSIVLDRSTAEVTLPPLGTNPTLQTVLPMRPVGVDPFGQLESGRIELEHSQTAELIAIGIEELIVINVGMFSKDPFAVRIQIGLGRLTLDQVAERVLALVGVR